MDRAAVETVSRTSRCVEHSALRPLINQRLAELEMPQFAYTTCLVKFCSDFRAKEADRARRAG